MSVVKILKPSVKPVLDLLEERHLTEVTFPAYRFIEENCFSPDDKDYVIFHTNKDSPVIADLVKACDYKTTEKPIYKDWYMTITYHA